MTKTMSETDRPLSMAHANRLARGIARIRRCEVDPALWHVHEPGNVRCAEIYEPMTRTQWLAFLEDWRERHGA